ncbi:MAG TPA: glycerophosphoryl diester phosphodiesterase membrane domain-containing protein, partial [Candidatus Baltobacteraceae bacterium]|nr:glycerophosphoryl diester phosphodiesterase membrane domain-containing protein [Candidatus Baltobacteraceae bacterium]
KRNFIHLFLGMLVPGLFIGVCMLPFIIFFVIKMIPAMSHVGNTQNPAQVFAAMKPAFLSCIPIFILCLIPVMYLGINWKFTLPLIIDKQMDFWTAMKTSWKMVHKHWLQVFGVVVLVGLLNLAGMALCCVGMLFTAPIGYATLMYAYETIFGDTQNS